MKGQYIYYIFCQIVFTGYRVGSHSWFLELFRPLYLLLLFMSAVEIEILTMTNSLFHSFGILVKRCALLLLNQLGHPAVISKIRMTLKVMVDNLFHLDKIFLMAAAFIAIFIMVLVTNYIPPCKSVQVELRPIIMRTLTEIVLPP